MKIPEEEKQISSKQSAETVSQIGVRASELPFSSEDDFKSIPEDPISSASSGDSMSEGEETPAETLPPEENSPELPKELPQRSQTPCGARRPAKMPDVHIPLCQQTQPTLVAPKPKTTSAEDNTEPDLDSNESTQQLFPKTGDYSAPKRKKTEHSRKSKPKKKK